MQLSLLSIIMFLIYIWNKCYRIFSLGIMKKKKDIIKELLLGIKKYLN
jgi:hypothetical protein